MRLLANDPGFKPGYATFQDGRLIHVSTAFPASGPYDVAVTERQFIAPRARGKKAAAPAGILTLAVTAGRQLERIGAPVELGFLATEWRAVLFRNGASLAKEVSAQRIYELRLDDAGRALVDDIKKTRRGDVLDAVGLGLAALKLGPEGWGDYQLKEAP